MDTTRMRTWAEIDLSALEHNYRTLRAMLPQGCRFGPLQGQCLWTWSRCDRPYPGASGGGYAGCGLRQRGGGAAAERGHAAYPVFGRDSGGADPLLLELDVTQMVEDLETGRSCPPPPRGAGGRPLRVHEAGHRHEAYWASVGGAGRRRRRTGSPGCALPGLEAEGLFTHLRTPTRARGLHYGPV